MKSLHFLLILFIFVLLFNEDNAQIGRVHQKDAGPLLFDEDHDEQQSVQRNQQQKQRQQAQTNVASAQLEKQKQSSPQQNPPNIAQQQEQRQNVTSRPTTQHVATNAPQNNANSNIRRKEMGGFGGQNEVNTEDTVVESAESGAWANEWRHELLNGAGQRLLEEGRQLLEKLEGNGRGETEKEDEVGKEPNRRIGQRQETEKNGQVRGERPMASSNSNNSSRTTAENQHQQGIGMTAEGEQPSTFIERSTLSIGKTMTTTTMTTSFSSTMLSTTTQDPIIKKQLDNAGAPEVMKLFVPPKPPSVPQEAKKIIEDKCAGGKCLVQKPEFVEQKAVVEKESQQIEQKLNPEKSVEQVKQEIQVRMTKTQQLKKALLKNIGLEGQVEPADNGVFGHDQLLTEAQANDLLNELARQQRPNRAKRAGNAIFAEVTSTKRWDASKAIPFMFDRSLADADKKAVREAVAEIQLKTCLKFTEVQAKPAGSHLYYTKIANPTFCGLSYVGRVEPANPIYLSFMCGHPAGVAVHETMHALGFQHEQLRIDRDQFISIQWENVNPQQLDFFTVSDVTKFSSYGIKYDYGSIMQYASTIASTNPSKKTMVAKLNGADNDRLMGQREGLSQSDVEALNKMYCQSGCDDKMVFCGIWATMNLCDSRMWRRAVVHAWIVSNCQKSCNKCGEKVQMIDRKPF